MAQQVACPLAGTHYNLTYFRKIPKRSTDLIKFTYTSELSKTSIQAGDEEQEKEYLARVDPLAGDMGQVGPDISEGTLIAGSSFAREILHYKISTKFTPWAVLENYPSQFGKFEFYMMFGAGSCFTL